MPTTAEKRTAFRRLHESGCFVIPNPWDIGTDPLSAEHGLQGAGDDERGLRLVARPRPTAG